MNQIFEREKGAPRTAHLQGRTVSLQPLGSHPLFPEQPLVLRQLGNLQSGMSHGAHGVHETANG